MGSDQVLASLPPLAGPRVGIHKYDFGVHLIAVRKGLREGGVEGLTIIVRGPRMLRMNYKYCEVPLSTTKFRDEEPRAQQPDRHDCWKQVSSYHDAYS